MSSERKDRATSRAWVEVDLAAIRANTRAAQMLGGANAAVMAVVKADAYGHGLLPVARAALEAGAQWLGVAAVEEASALRQAGIDAPLCLLCAHAPDEAETVIRNHVTPLIGDAPTLRVFAEAAARQMLSPSPSIHLEIDTGIGRAGCAPDDAVDLWRLAQRMGLRVTGLATHFADADNPDDAFSRDQERAFARTLAELRQAGAHFDSIHAASSPAALRGYAPAANLLRPGLLLYGQDSGFRIQDSGQTAPVPQPSVRERTKTGSPLADINPQPALSLRARVATVRDMAAGSPISYGMTHRLARRSRIATVLIGYGDGYPRRLSNRGEMLVRGRRAPILGRVCMDQTVVDVTDIPDVAPGDVATCLGKDGAEEIRVADLARLLDTICHDVLVGLTARLPRVYVGS